VGPSHAAAERRAGGALAAAVRASSLFPHLLHRSRTPFRAGLAILFLAPVAFALLRLQAPLILVSALGLPLLFVLYLRESDVDHDVPIRSLLLTTVLGVGLGVGWALLTGAIVAHSYDVALGPEPSDAHSLVEGFIIPTAGAVLMLVPMIVVRVLRPLTRESLDGFVIGALSAIAFTAAAT
jgi:hypothetical protein